MEACTEKKTREFERESFRSHSWEFTLEVAMDLVQYQLCSERDKHSLQIQ